MGSRPDVLVVFSPLRAQRGPDDQVVVTQKFADGIAQFAQFWDGPVRAVLEATDEPTSDLDHLAVRSTPEIQYVVTDFNEPTTAQHLRDAAVAMVMPDHRQLALGALCSRLGVPYVVVTEITLKTRLRIAGIEEAGLLARARRSAWEIRQEELNRALIREAAGVQCNGIPTYEAYNAINENMLLYFDTRAGQQQIVSEERLEDRLAARADKRLNLVFSGRFVDIKGIMHCLPFAEELKRRNVDFTLNLFGGGELEDSLRSSIERQGLQEQIKLHGVVTLSELMTWCQQEADAFVCFHRQGDPSCTYHETLACGVPIVGYANEAFRGLLLQAPVGEAAALDDPAALAERVDALHQDRSSLARYSRKARAWALEHCFEKGFGNRIEHLREIVASKETSS